MASSGRIQQEPTHPHSEYLDPSLIRKGIENGSIIQVSALYWVEPVSLLPVLILNSEILRGMWVNSTVERNMKQGLSSCTGEHFLLLAQRSVLERRIFFSLATGSKIKQNSHPICGHMLKLISYSYWLKHFLESFFCQFWICSVQR